VNRLLAIACVLLVLTFRSSGNLASAYGIAVTGTMAITTLLFCVVARDLWRWSWLKVGALGSLFLAVDLAFLGANADKVVKGGWVPLVVALIVFVLMTTWKRGRHIVSGILRENALPVDLFLQDIARKRPPRVPGTAVFMTSDPDGVPVVLLHHLKHNKVLHESVVLMSVEGVEIPYVPESDRYDSAELGEGFHRVVAHYGFMETPDVPGLLKQVETTTGLRTRPQETSFYLGRETLLPTGNSRLSSWRKKLFIVMARNAQPATVYFRLPANRVLELGAQIQF
jgi:KUP system potassium uptake protein